MIVKYVNSKFNVYYVSMNSSDLFNSSVSPIATINCIWDGHHCYMFAFIIIISSSSTLLLADDIP